MKKIERLAVAAAVAPSLRSDADRLRRRRIKRIDADGNVVGEIDALELSTKLLLRNNIELSVQEADAKSSPCLLCGRPVVSSKQGVRSICRADEGCWSKIRCECGAMPPKSSTYKIARKYMGDPSFRWACRECWDRAHRDVCACGRGKPAYAKRCDHCPAPQVARPAARKAARSCSCGTPLSRANSSGKCGPCYTRDATKPKPHQATCITCEKVPRKEYFTSAQIRQRSGRPWQCFECACRPKRRAHNVGTPDMGGLALEK